MIDKDPFDEEPCNWAEKAKPFADTFRKCFFEEGYSEPVLRIAHYYSESKIELKDTLKTRLNQHFFSGVDTNNPAIQTELDFAFSGIEEQLTELIIEDEPETDLLADINFETVKSIIECEYTEVGKRDRYILARGCFALFPYDMRDDQKVATFEILIKKYADYFNPLDFELYDSPQIYEALLNLLQKEGVFSEALDKELASFLPGYVESNVSKDEYN